MFHNSWSFHTFVQLLLSLQMYKESEIRNYEIKELYFIVLKKAMKRGVSLKEAKDEAFSAVELRYCISKGTTENIIYKSIRQVGSMYETLFKIRNIQLKELLEEICDATD